MALVLLDLQCDNSCNDPGVSGPWYRTRDAWQWKAQFGLTVLGLVSAVVTADQATRSHYKPAAAALTASAILFGGWALLLRDGGVGGF